MCPLKSHQPWPPCRGEALVIGGDLAYPSPTNETYETRFFRPYEAAMPAPAHAVPGALVLQKPDLPLDGCSGCRAPPSQGCALHSEHGQRHQAAGACRWVLHNACRDSYSICHMLSPQFKVSTHLGPAKWLNGKRYPCSPHSFGYSVTL